MNEALVGNLLTLGVAAVGWYCTVTNWRRQDQHRADTRAQDAARQRDRMHDENVRRVDKLEKCVHRHLGNDDDVPIRDRVLTVEQNVRYMLERERRQL